MSSGHEAAIRVAAVSKRFGRVTALDNVSFSVERGELFFLLGPSGCGKTTMLRILAGLERPDAGDVFFLGRDVRTMPPHLRGAPMVFQNYALWPHLSVRDNVAFGLVERRVRKPEIEERTRAALARVGLEGFGARMPGQLSGGQQQRVVLARALVLNPDVILLDEPLSNLDARLRHEMREEIAQIHAETDITFVYVTHDQAEALSLADRMAVMRDGRISAAGAPADLYHRPPTLFCAQFLGEANVLEATLTGVAGGGRVCVQTPLGAWQAAWCGAEDPARRLGSAVRCVARPECVGIGAAAPGRNTFAARVSAVRVQGATLGLRMEAGGVAVLATVLNRPGAAPAAGDEVQCSVDPSDCVALPAEA